MVWLQNEITVFLSERMIGKRDEIFKMNLCLPGTGDLHKFRFFLPRDHVNGQMIPIILRNDRKERRSSTSSINIFIFGERKAK